MQILISAGEASGEAYGAQLIAALRRRVPDATFFGLGGEAMRAAGCHITVNTRDLAVVGLAEVVSHLPRIYREYRKLLGDVDQRRPAAAVLIDSPDFNFRLARQLHRRGVPVFYYVSPQLWAWRPRRIELVRRYVRKMLVIFPFEEAWYRERGVDAVYVGHPLADVPPPAISREAFAAAKGLDAAKPWIAILPGSRRKEVTMNLPAMLRGAARCKEYELVLPVASTLDPAWVAALAARERVAVKLTRDSRATLQHARVAVVASGTATLEAALLGTPFVMVYRVSPLTWMLGRRLVQVSNFCIVNLVLGREAVVELVQKNFTAERVAAALETMVADGPQREAMLTAFAELRQKLHPGAQSAAERAAEIITAKA
ncbi:MAG: lipid-A-disaccharide synthase [Terriglobales bacterium]